MHEARDYPEMIRNLQKTDASADAIALDAGTATVLAGHRQRQQAEPAAAGPDWHESGLVFTTHTGHPLHPTEFSVGWAVGERERTAIAALPTRAWTDAIAAEATPAPVPPSPN